MEGGESPLNLWRKKLGIHVQSTDVKFLNIKPIVPPLSPPLIDFYFNVLNLDSCMSALGVFSRPDVIEDIYDSDCYVNGLLPRRFGKTTILVACMLYYIMVEGRSVNFTSPNTLTLNGVDTIYRNLYMKLPTKYKAEQIQYPVSTHTISYKNGACLLLHHPRKYMLSYGMINVIDEYRLIQDIDHRELRNYETIALSSPTGK